MADAYDVVRSYHAAQANLTEARLAVSRTTTRTQTRAAEAAVAAAERAAAGARAAVVAALREGRVTSATALLDMPNDCLDCVVAFLSPKEAARASGACRALREAVVRAGMPPTIGEVGVSDRMLSLSYQRTQDLQSLVERVHRCPQALGVRRAAFCGCSRPNARHPARRAARHAALLEAFMDAVPRVTRVDVEIGAGDLAVVEAIADVLLARAGRGFELGLKNVSLDEDGPALRRIADGGIPVVSLGIWFDDDQDASAVAATSRTLTSLSFSSFDGVLPRLPLLPHLRRLKLITDDAFQLSTGQALTTVMPRLNEIVIVGTGSYDHSPPLYCLGEHAFWSPLRSITRLVLKPVCIASRIDWGGLQLMTALRELSIFAQNVAVAPGGDICVDLPQLAPSLSRLIAIGAVRFRRQTASVLAGLRVLDLRRAFPRVACIVSDDLQADIRDAVERQVDAPLVLPPAAATPRLSTLLLGYYSFGAASIFDLASLLHSPRPALATVLVEFATLTCSAAARGLDARLRAALPALRRVHLHSCMVDPNAASATEAFIGALERSGVRVCRSSIWMCMLSRLYYGEENEHDDWTED